MSVNKVCLRRRTHCNFIGHKLQCDPQFGHCTEQIKKMHRPHANSNLFNLRLKKMFVTWRGNFLNSLFTRNQQFQQPTHKSNFISSCCALVSLLHRITRTSRILQCKQDDGNPCKPPSQGRREKTTPPKGKGASGMFARQERDGKPLTRHHPEEREGLHSAMVSTCCFQSCSHKDS